MFQEINVGNIQIHHLHEKNNFIHAKLEMNTDKVSYLPCDKIIKHFFL